MTRVLIASDGSDVAVKAARRGYALLGQPTDTVVLAVVPPAVLAGGAPSGVEGVPAPLTAPETASEIDHALTDEAQAGLDRTVEALGGRATAQLVHGDPPSEICRMAKEGGFDVVVVGSHGRGLVERVLMGSVSRHVINHAPCPVLVVRDPG